MTDITTVLLVGAPLYLAAVVIYTVRLVKGPSIPDMVLAVDCIAYDLAVFLLIIALYYRTPLLVAPSIMLALWAYLLDVFISKHLVSKEVGE